MTDLTLAQASNLATEITLSKTYATTAVNIASNTTSEVQTVKITQNKLKNKFDTLLDLLKTAQISGLTDASLNDLSFNTLKNRPEDG